MTQEEAAKIKSFHPEECFVLNDPETKRILNVWEGGLDVNSNWMDDLHWVEEEVKSIDIHDDYAFVTFYDEGCAIYYGKFQLTGEPSPANGYLNRFTTIEAQIETDRRHLREEVVRALKIHLHNKRNHFDKIELSLIDKSWLPIANAMEETEDGFFIGKIKSTRITTRSLIDVLASIEKCYKTNE